MGAVLNAANEVAVQRFLDGGMAFSEIVPAVSETMAAHSVVEDPTLEDILAADAWARERAGGTAGAGGGRC